MSPSLENNTGIVACHADTEYSSTRVASDKIFSKALMSFMLIIIEKVYPHYFAYFN